MKTELYYRELHPADVTEAQLGRLAELAAAAPDPWSREDMIRVLEDENHRLFAAFEAGAGPGEGVAFGGEGGTPGEAHGPGTSTSLPLPIAFAAFCALAQSETADLELVAVLTNKRRNGVAKSLLDAAFTALAQGGAKQVLLEMRASNAAAAALYAALGAKTLARRPGMYSHPREDGLMLGIPLGAHIADE